MAILVLRKKSNLDGSLTAVPTYNKEHIMGVIDVI